MQIPNESECGPLERRISQLESELATVSTELDSVLYSISHDLRAPLMAIGGFTDLLFEQQSGLDETGRRYLQRIREGNLRLTKLLEGLLKLSRIARQPMIAQAVDLTTLARETMERLQASFPLRTADLEFPESMVVHGDPQLLKSLMDGLLENAWKFTVNQPRPRITLNRTVQNGRSCFCVRDNGAGFDQRYGDKLFKPLQRLHSEKQFPGIGIGLATAAKIVQRHGGEIWAEGAVDQGASIYFTLAATS